MNDGTAPETPFGESPESERVALERLAQTGGRELVADMAAIYLEEMPARLFAARTALGAGDARALAAAAHAMKSSSAQLGGLTLASECEAVEDAAERGDMETAAARFETLETELAAFSARLAGYAADARPEAKKESRTAAGPIIAVVEDNADNRLLVDAILNGRFVLHEYVTGSEAMDSMPHRVPALVLLDVSLPGMDGLEVLSRMRNDATLRAVPVVALTAHAMPGDRERYLAAGFDDYVAKPIEDEDVLIGAIERLLARTVRAPRGTLGENRP
jgi:two-component system, cell cycle response regulator DivK